MHGFKYLFLLPCLMFIIGGCSHHAALDQGQDKMDLSSHSVALLAVKVSNLNKPDYQPFPYMVFVEGAGVFKFHENGPHKKEHNRFTEYLLSFRLKPGLNRFDKIWFDYHGVFIGARASIPMNLKVDIKPHTVVYLGRLSVVIRPKKSDEEESAGASLPAVNQAAAGFSTGGYDVTVEDGSAGDLEWFLSEYPALRKVNIEKTIFPDWVRPGKK